MSRVRLEVNRRNTEMALTMFLRQWLTVLGIPHDKIEDDALLRRVERTFRPTRESGNRSNTSNG